MQVSDLTGPALDWAVAKACSLSTSPLTLDAGITCKYVGELGYVAWSSNGLGPHTNEHSQFGPSPLIAICRCFVAKTLGDEIDLPEELQ